MRPLQERSSTRGPCFRRQATNIFSSPQGQHFYLSRQVKKSALDPDWPTTALGSATRSRLAEDLEIDGDVSSSGPVDIPGRITGTVRAPDVLVSTSGRVAGQVMALNLSVLGTIEGAIVAKSVSLSGSSRVQADINHETITIETGAQFEGSLKRKS